MINEKELKPDKSIDTIGLYCPVPLFRTREALELMNKGEVLEVFADDPAAESDIQSFTKRTGHELLKLEKDEDVLHFLIKKTK
ncbi:MAG TPA: sulfurtransferase TusA family protein [Candidatus Deferrimicrobium sp.]|nr:sulfurtransferase TusA family protein [Candidatus Deferrimicrobium sp.]